MYKLLSPEIPNSGDRGLLLSLLAQGGTFTGRFISWSRGDRGGSNCLSFVLIAFQVNFGLGRSTGEGIGYPLQYSWASLVAQTVKKPPAMQEIWV